MTHMKIGIIGAGKLGLPVALAIESMGHTVQVYDTNPRVRHYLADRKIPYKEQDLQPLLDATKITMADSLSELLAGKDIVFVAVQTPHEPQYEGATPLPDGRQDFDYTALKCVVRDVAEFAASQGEQVTLAVISTCLPGTFNREIEPLLNKSVNYVYTPQFIAMGTVLQDYLHPEFHLIGVCDGAAAEKLQTFYKTLTFAPHVVTDITTAEGIKVSYNTWITAKTVIANAWGELCDHLNMNFDDMYKAWSLSTDRIISPKYMRAGMSDGGGCHPRDNIALSWLAHDVGMSHNIWEDLMQARQECERRHAQVAVQVAARCELPLILMGKAFKPETNIQTGSAALLMASFVADMDQPFTHQEEGRPQFIDKPAVYFICTQHERYRAFPFPKGSVVIDPFRYVPDIEGVDVIRLGERQV